MNSIDSQIKALLRKKAKIEMLQKIEDLVNAQLEDKDHPGLKKEIKEFFSQKIQAEIKIIQEVEGQIPVAQISSNTFLTPTESMSPSASKKKPNHDLKPFVEKYTAFGFKKVKGLDENGNEISGIVMQIAYPNLKIKLDSGELVLVDPTNIELENK